MALPLGLPAAAHAVAEKQVEGVLPSLEIGQAVAAQALPLLGGGTQRHVKGQLPGGGGRRVRGRHGLYHQVGQLGVLPAAALPLLLQLAPVLPPQQQGRDLRVDGGDQLREMDTPAGKVDGEVRRFRPAPLHDGGGGVIEGIEGGEIVLVPAHVPQRAAPAHHLGGPVEDDGGILLLPGGGRADALAEGAQRVGAQPQALTEAVRLPRGLAPG